jgi:hypothetical protein
MEQNVYITNASLNMIFKSLRNKKISLSREELLSHISLDFEDEFEGTSFRDNIHLTFNTMELKEIYFEGMVLKNISKVIDEIEGNKNIIEEYIMNSNKSYAYQIKAPAFHTTNNCNLLQSNFENIVIPEDCKIDETKRELIKEWIKANRNKYPTFTDLNAKFKIEFQCDCNLEEVSRLNSGSIDFENYNIKVSNIVSDIKNKFVQLRFFFDSEFAKKIENFKYATTYKLKNQLSIDKDKETHKSIIDYHTVKDSLRQMISEHYRYNYNIALSFDQKILKAIGFRSCNGCNKLALNLN